MIQPRRMNDPRALQGLQQLGHIDRLAEKIMGSILHGFDRQIDFSKGCH
jgi:hypothetical protein